MLMTRRADVPIALVIGSGFGGLAAALRLNVRGWRVQVLEKLGTAGDRACVHRQDGFSFDASPTIVTAAQLLEELWALCGRRLADGVELRAIDAFYRIRCHDGSHFDVSQDPQRMRAEVARFNPARPPFGRLQVSTGLATSSWPTICR
jgi:phytoene desaturase